MVSQVIESMFRDENEFTPELVNIFVFTTFMEHKFKVSKFRYPCVTKMILGMFEEIFLEQTTADQRGRLDKMNLADLIKLRN